MDVVTHIFQIYQSCDPNNTDSVLVSSLINFIRPFMFDDLSELEKLQAQLDPEGSNPAVSSSFFHQVMSDWIAKIDKDNCSSNLSEMANNNMKSGDPPGLFLPRSDTFVLGLSQNNASTISNASTNNNTIALEEQIQKLQHQLVKTVKELELVKQQLASSEEQNESLLGELNRLHKLKHREQQLHEESLRGKQENEEIKEVASMANKKITELGKTLFDHEKQNEYLQDQINQLENENSFLKIKVQKLEQNRNETRKSVTELEGALDSKDSEITALMEIADELKKKLDEKTELVKFYMNENKLVKQKVETLEELYHDMFPDEVFSPKAEEIKVDAILYNSPKLLSQVSNPITPTIDSPMNFKKCLTSSPIKKVNTSTDLFSSTGIVTVLRSPHKTLKEELSEVSNIKLDHNEVKRLQQALKEQEIIKNNLWEDMKRLSEDNEALREYKQKCDELYQAVEEKDKLIKRLESVIEETESNAKVTEDKYTLTESWQERDELIQTLKEKLQEQNHISADLMKQLQNHKYIHRDDKSTETCVNTNQEERIQVLENEIKILQRDLDEERLKNIQFPAKEKLDKSTETNKDENVWMIPIMSSIPESKKTNFSKQQIRMEKLLEKQEQMEKDLNIERGQNRFLTSKLQDLFKENVQIKEELKLCTATYSKALEDIKALENGRDRLQQQVLQLTSEKLAVGQDLQNTLNTMAVDKSMIQKLRIENTILINKIRQLEVNTKQDCIREMSLKKHVINLKELYSSELNQLTRNITEKNYKILELRNQIVHFELFLSEINEELSSIITHRNDYTVGDNSTSLKELQIEIKDSSSLKGMVDKLSQNCQLIMRLLKDAHNKSDEKEVERGSSLLYNVSQSISSSSGEEFFEGETSLASSTEDQDIAVPSCIDEFTNNRYLEIIQFEADSFLDNLELSETNLRNLTRKELEDKFTTLALILTMDVATSNKRYFDQKERCNRLFIQFFNYINHVVALMKQQKPVAQFEPEKILNLLRNVSEEVFRSAFRCGVLHYERRTLHCWNLVINYVATLTKDNKQTKHQGSDESSNVTKTLTPIPLQNQIKYTVKNDFVIQARYAVCTISSVRLKIMIWNFRSGLWKTLKYCIVTTFFLMFVSCVLLVLYVDSICLKQGRQVCPIEWLLGFLVKRVHSHNVL